MAIAGLQASVGQQGIDPQAAAGALQLQEIGLALPVAKVIEPCTLVASQIDLGQVELRPLAPC